MKEGIKLILRYFLAVIVWGLIVAGIIGGFFTLHADSYCREEIAAFISVFLATVLASYCLPVEQRFYLGIILSIWIVFFGFFLKEFVLIVSIVPVLLGSFLHYIKEKKLFISYFMGIVFVLIIVPFYLLDNALLLGGIDKFSDAILNLFNASKSQVVHFAILAMMYSVVNFTATIAFAFFLPGKHRLYFALAVAFLGIFPRFIWFIISLTKQGDLGIQVWILGSFFLGTIAAVLFLYWRQKKLENRVDHSFQKTP